MEARSKNAGAALAALIAVALTSVAGSASAHVGRGGVELDRHGDPASGFGSKRSGRLPATSAGGGGVGSSAATSASSPCPAVDRTSDDSEHALHPPSAAVIKVIYAHPSDVPDRLAKYAPVIEAGVQAASGFVALSSGNTRSLRLDLGTARGPGCLDIQRVALPLPTSAYTTTSTTPFTLIKTQVSASLGSQPGVRNYLVYADGIDIPGVAGEAQIFNDDSYAGAAHGRGGLFAVLYGSGGSDFFGSSVSYAAGTTSRLQVEVALHEITHNLGGVQRSSPNHTNSFHCRDEWDILCYDDDGGGGLSMFLACDSPYSSGYEAWDCNHDDYFDPDPQPGSYLASHWNLYRSIFLCDVSACGSGWAAGPVDDRSPETSIRWGPRRVTRDRTPTFGFRSDEPGSIFECSLDLAAYRSCASPLTLRRLRRGRHLFRVRALDPADNLDPSPARRRFRIARRR